MSDYFVIIGQYNVFKLNYFNHVYHTGYIAYQ